MVTRQEVMDRVRRGETYEAVGRALGISAGKAYMIATGVPADYSDSLGADDYGREGLELGGTQYLLGVPHHNPTRPEDKPEVIAWVKRRAAADTPMRSAAGKR